jgi:hypothetical protein
VNPFGPVQVYAVAPFAVVAFSVIVVPVQYGPRLEAVTPQTGTHDKVPPPAASEILTDPEHPPKFVKSIM